MLFLKVNLKMNEQQSYIAAECTEPLECDPFFVDLHKAIDKKDIFSISSLKGGSWSLF